MKSYSVEQAGSLKELAKKVNEQIACGCEPLGGIYAFQQLTDKTKHVSDRGLSTLSDAGVVYLQAMVYEEPTQ